MPGTPVRAAWDTLRRVRAHRASSSAPRWPIRRRTSGVVPGSGPRRQRRGARGGAPSTASTSLTKAVPRSKLRVTMVTRQPSFSSPTRLATGTRTSSRKSSANSVDPAMVLSGRKSMPGRVHRHGQPGDPAVTAVLRDRCAPAARRSRPPRRGEVQIFDPVTTYSSPSRTARVRSEARSLPAPGSEKPWHHTSSPRRIGGQEPRPLLGGALDHDGGAGVQEPDEVHPDIGRMGPLELLQVDELLDRTGTPTAALDGPVDAGVAGVEEHALPGGVVGAPGGPVETTTACGPRVGTTSASQARSSARNASSSAE